MMASEDGTKKKRPRRSINLCRICLTLSPSMRDLSQNLENLPETVTILEILEKVMCCEVVVTKQSPNQVCSVCLSLLSLSYDLKNKFELSQKKLFGNLKKKDLDAEEKSSTEVELIIGNNNYNLDDIVIVEDDGLTTENTNSDYSQYLSKLGKTVSVEYLGRTANEGNNIKTGNAEDDILEYENTPIIPISSDNVSQNSLETEEYETIIIKFESDTEETYPIQTKYSPSSNTVVKSRKTPPFFKKLDSVITAGDEGDEEKPLIKEEIKNISDDDFDSGNSINVKPKRRKKGSGLEDVQKFIIYKTDDEYEPKVEVLAEDEIKKENDKNSNADTAAPQNVRNKRKRDKNIEKFIICEPDELDEDEGLEEEISMNENNKTLDGTAKRAKKKKKDLTIEEDIEKFIIYRTDEGGNSESDTKDDHNWEDTKVKHCKLCSMSFDTRWTYKRHLLDAHGIRVGKAPRRRKANKLPKEVIMKRRIQRLKERYLKNPMLCQICGYISKSYGGAKYHSLTHGEKMYKCDLCPKSFYTPSHLKNHFQNKHERRTTSHLCSICGEHRNSSTALGYHMKLHTNYTKKFTCPICDVSFLMKGALNTHLRRHMGDRRYPCNMCERSFFSNNERKKHLMTHTGERPHKCKYCDRRFVTTFNQKIHMMTHTGSFLCQICFRGLVDEDMLRLHMKTKHSSSSSFKSEPEEPDAGERYDKYELLIQSPGKCPDNVILEDLNLLDIVEDFNAD